MRLLLIAPNSLTYLLTYCRPNGTDVRRQGTGSVLYDVASPLYGPTIMFVIYFTYL